MIKTRECSKGFPCGKTCISRKRQCWANLSTDGNRMAESFSQYITRTKIKLDSKYKNTDKYDLNQLSLGSKEARFIDLNSQPGNSYDKSRETGFINDNQAIIDSIDSMDNKVANNLKDIEKLSLRLFMNGSHRSYNKALRDGVYDGVDVHNNVDIIGETTEKSLNKLPQYDPSFYNDKINLDSLEPDNLVNTPIKGGPTEDIKKYYEDLLESGGEAPLHMDTMLVGSVFNETKDQGLYNSADIIIKSNANKTRHLDTLNRDYGLTGLVAADRDTKYKVTKIEERDDGKTIIYLE